MAHYDELRPEMRIQVKDIFGDWVGATITEVKTRYNKFEGQICSIDKIIRYDYDKINWQGAKKGLQWNTEREGDDFPNIRIL